MKRTLIFSFVFVLISSLLCLGVSAAPLARGDSLNDGVSIRSVPDDPSGYPYTYTFKEVLTSPEGDIPVSFEYDGQPFTNIAIFNNNLVYYSSTLSTSIVVYHFSTNTWVDDSYRTIVFDEIPSRIPWLNANEYNPASPQVGASLTFIGQVLNFVTTNSSTLALLGLSIGLFLILPFSIRKLKEFVKGY